MAAELAEFRAAGDWVDWEPSLDSEILALAPASDVVDSLADAPLRSYRVLFENGGGLLSDAPAVAQSRSLVRPVRAGWAFSWPDSKQTELREEFEESLRNWALRWRLGPSWVLETARATVHFWCTLPGLLEQRRWAHPPVAGLSGSRSYRVGWWRAGEDLGQFEKRVRATFMEKLERDLAVVRREVAPLGALFGANRQNDLAYVWAVRALVLREPSLAIATAFDRATSTVGEAVRDLLAFVGLPGPPTGRPKGSRSTHRVRHLR